jgi:ribose 5-phosphate isomerase B
MIFNKIAIANDHAGYKMKEDLKVYLSEKGVKVKDFGSFSSDSVDYPDFAHSLAKSIENMDFDAGIAICGTGNGINMTVNKHQKIRGALCWNKEIAHLARAHNDANICSLPARFVSLETASEIVETFLNTPFDGGRHSERVKKIYNNE